MEPASSGCGRYYRARAGCRAASRPHHETLLAKRTRVRARDRHCLRREENVGHLWLARVFRCTISGDPETVEKLSTPLVSRLIDRAGYRHEECGPFELAAGRAC